MSTPKQSEDSKKGFICPGSPDLPEFLKIKAVACLIASFVSAGLGMNFYDRGGILALLPGVGLIITAILLFCFETPMKIGGFRLAKGNRDDRNLY